MKMTKSKKRTYATPSKANYIDLINSIRYVNIKNSIEAKNTYKISRWLSNLEDLLNNYLRKKASKWKNINPKKRCRDINHILDDIIQKMVASKIFGYVKWEIEIDNSVKNSLRKYAYLDCKRTYDNLDKKNIELRKTLDDICEDTIYIQNNITKFIERGNCNEVTLELEARFRNFIQKETPKIDMNIFHFDNECKLENIETMIGNIKCEVGPESVMRMRQGGHAKPLKPVNFGLPSQEQEQLQSQLYSLGVDGPRLTNGPGPDEDVQDEDERDEDERDEDINGYPVFSSPLDDEEEELASESTESGKPGYINATSVSLSVLGIASVCFLLYKVTPVGSWIRSRIGGNDKINSYLNTDESNEMMFDDHEYNIAYDAVSDSYLQ
ncbi:PIR Superfamily Protein [Plasmodium ovale wallikeri]|uniref:PIR Superfamily Protein n=1 Tax=Plasmodium ovale wallikeri TaxID=864142 RepID=A0A1A9ALB1_PLAOA|nr:PIR Superfamily Protein [Plasmodium ovale wallikeri]SBT57622.1 PIR Superfamily Protein [Plasmodium ovale wallikeri]